MKRPEPKNVLVNVNQDEHKERHAEIIQMMRELGLVYKYRFIKFEKDLHRELTQKIGQQLEPVGDIEEDG